MLVQTEEDMQQVLEVSRRNPMASVDLETTGLNPYHGDYLIGVAMRFMPEDKSYYLPFRHQTGTNLDMAWLRRLAPWFANPTNVAVGFNVAGFDYHFLEKDNIRVLCAMHDVMLLAHLNDENEKSFSLISLASAYIDENATDEETKLKEELARGKLSKGQMNRLPPSLVAPYAEKDAELTWLLYGAMLKKLDKQGLQTLTPGMHEYSTILADIKRRGLLIDVALCEERMKEAQNSATTVLAQMVEDGLVPHTFNPNSHTQVKAKLGTHTSDKETLEVVARDGSAAGAVAGGVLAYRAWDKVASSFYEPLLRESDGYGVLHPNLNIIGTVTGRLSCTSPNMQALPRTSGDVYRVRDVITAPRGYSLLSVDFAQAEMRVATYYAAEQTMLSILKSDKDIHGETAILAGVGRQDAKGVNFGVIYGIGPEALAQNLSRSSGEDRSEQEAKEILDRYHAQFPGFRRLMYKAEKQATEKGYIRLWTGRRRHYNEHVDPHKAMSNLIQGAVGEIVRVTMTRMDKYLLDKDARMVLQIHDDILLYVADDQVDYLVPALKALAEDFRFGEVPIKTEVKVGKRWGCLREWHPQRLV